MNYKHSFPDFLTFCSDQGLKIVEDGETLWENNKPAPKELIRKMFFDTPLILEKFMDHLFSAVIVSLGDLKYKTIFFESLPASKTLKEQAKKEELCNYYDEFSNMEQFNKFRDAVVGYSGIQYTPLSLERFYEAISHQGKKYTRLYYPRSIKDLIKEMLPNCQRKHLTREKGDFLGNQLCDTYNIYRSGYSDLLSIIFNKYLDFKFDYLQGYDPSKSTQGQQRSEQFYTAGELIYSNNMRGNLWSPIMRQNGTISAKVNNLHPIFEVEDKDKFKLLILALSEIEMGIFEEEQKSKQEQLRFRVSKQIENMLPLKKSLSTE